ncbi:peptidoglycan-binding domain-containing protein [Asticcacaulis sp. AC402]|uniref:peptidoglycan-binding domain-containing protein n=1 Tax=Asticcacaulis sp. AC402 TaxID=1282361 RepID=UPI0003C40D40|nr:peptidoglycan-binding domain-containing protein [Asticcacaulis sp. AC402]ESQ74676.1 hypothetical protein ABAC402_13035 [Asticcacaulis sp. AC402]
MSKLFLNSGVAVVALSVLALAGSASAFGNKPAVKPVSTGFTESSQHAAGQTVAVVQSGSPGPAVPAGDVVAYDGGEGSAAWQAVPEELRKYARPGQCFAKLLVAPEFETYKDRVLVAEARTETRTIAEVVEWRMKDVLVEPEKVMRRSIPPKTRQFMETEVVTPAGFRDEVIPARYETRTERVMVQPERQVWVEKAGIATGAALVTPVTHEAVRYRADGSLTWPGKYPVVIPTDNATTQYLQQGSAQTVLCLEVLPAVYQDRKVKVMVEPERVRRVEVPAVTRQVRRVVIASEGREEEYVVPAVYKKQKVKEVITPARVETVEIPAVYREEVRSRVTDGAQPVWREVLCDRNASPALVSDIQRELNKRGYNAGPVDGKLGSGTVSAMQKFQADQGLPQGQMSVESVRALGIKL